MGGWLKALIATACVVVIGWGGYLGYREISYRVALHKAEQAERDLAAIVEMRRQRAAESEAGIQAEKRASAREQEENLKRDNACVSPVSRARAILAARAAGVSPVYNDSIASLQEVIKKMCKRRTLHPRAGI